MTRDFSACVVFRHSGFAAEQGNENLVPVGWAKPESAIAKKIMHHFSRLGIRHYQLSRAYLFPSRDGVADDRINRFAKSRAGFVGWHIWHMKIANRIARQNFMSGGNLRLFSLPADTTHA